MRISICGDYLSPWLTILGAAIWGLWHLPPLFTGIKAVRDKKIKTRKHGLPFRSKEYEAVGGKAVFWGKTYIIGGALMFSVPLLMIIISCAWQPETAVFCGVSVWLVGLVVTAIGDTRAFT